MTDVINDEKAVVDLDAAQPQPGVASDELVRQLAERARAEGLRLTGEGGLLSQLTKVVVESALEGELDDHLGYGKHDPAGRDGGNSRNGKRGKTVLTEAGPVSIEVPRDREGSFEPQLVKKRQRRLTGLDDLVISLSAKGLTHGEICAHLAEVYGASVSKQTISTITDRVIEGMAEWQSRPLDSVYPVIFIDAVNVKIRDGNVANRPIYIALAVTVEGTRDILGLWAGEHGDGEGAKFWVRVLSEIKNRGTAMSAWWSATDSRACPRRSKPCGRKRSPRRASCTCCATASATPRRSTGRRSPRISNRSTPRRANRPPSMRSSPFTEAWGDRYPAIIKLWESAWPEFVPFLQFDTHIRAVVCTTNAIESINARIRRAVNARGHFPTEAAALKCVYLAIMSLDPTGRGRRRWSNRWKEALNAFEITFDGRLSAGRK